MNNSQPWANGGDISERATIRSVMPVVLTDNECAALGDKQVVRIFGLLQSSRLADLGRGER